MFPEIERILIDRDRIAARVGEVGRALAADLTRDLAAEGNAPADGGRVVMVPILTGSVVFLADLIREMPVKLSLGVVAVSSYPGKSVASKGAALRSELPKDLAGKHVVVVDDILDSGRTFALVKSLIEEQGPASVRTCTFLRKPADVRAVEIDADYSCFEIPDEFVVGYGLDYDGYYRNLPEVAVLDASTLEDAEG